MGKRNYYQNRQNRNGQQPKGIADVIAPIISETEMTTEIGVTIDETVRIPISEYRALVTDAAMLAAVNRLISLDAKESYISSDHVRAAISTLCTPDEEAKE